MNRKPLMIGLGALVAVIVIAVAAFFVINSRTPGTKIDVTVDTMVPVSGSEEVVTCLMETKICPDGNIVVRDGTNGCEFYDCPVDITDTSNTP